MRNLLLVVFLLGLCVFSAQAALTVLEDFDTLSLGSIDMQHEIDEWGCPIELWNAQANTNTRYDSGWSNVIEDDIKYKCLQLINRDRDGQIDTVYTTMYLGYDNRITNRGTIYLLYKANGPNDCMMCFNDNLPGYESDVIGDPIGDESVYQGTTNFSAQAALVRLSGGEDFRARHDNSYQYVDMGLQANVWNEMWIQFDVPNRTTRYYVCEAGASPEVVINPVTGGEWWGWRDDSNVSIDNIKWVMGMYSYLGDSVESVVLIDTIAIEDDWTTEALWYCEPPLLADIDGDGCVNIYDFLILRANYGTMTGATRDMGDLNGDGAINIYDFLILRSGYGLCNEGSGYIGQIE